MNIKERLDAIHFQGKLPTDAFSFPSSALVPSHMRGSLKLALSGAESFKWPGLDTVKQGWSSKKYDDNKWLEKHQGLVFNGHFWYCSQELGTLRRCHDATTVGPVIGDYKDSAYQPETLKTCSIGEMCSRMDALPKESPLYALYGVTIIDCYKDSNRLFLYTHLGEVEFLPIGGSKILVEGADAHPSATGVIIGAMEHNQGKYWCGLSLAFWDDISGVCPEASSPLIYPAKALDGQPGGGDLLVAQRSCPWVAVNPWDGLLYSAPFVPHRGPNGGSLIHVYDMNERVPLSFRFILLHPELRLHPRLLEFLDTDGDEVLWVYRFVKTLELGADVSEIQGGCFSNDGCLYLLNNSESGHGVWRFSMLNGALLDKIGVDKEAGKEQETEGVCIYGPRASSAPPLSGNGGGYICATVWNYDVGYSESGGMDVVYFKTMPLLPWD